MIASNFQVVLNLDFFGFGGGQHIDVALEQILSMA